MGSDNLAKAVEAAHVLGLRAGEVETLEESEAVTSLCLPQVLDLITDEKTREDVRWLQAAHVRQNNHRWTNVANLVTELFAKSGGAVRVRAYHEMEAFVTALSLSEIESVGDGEVKDALMAIKFIHTKTQERMVRLVSKCYDR